MMIGEIDNRVGRLFFRCFFLSMLCHFQGYFVSIYDWLLDLNVGVRLFAFALYLAQFLNFLCSSVASVTLVNPLEDMDISNQFFQIVLIFRKWFTFIILKHQQIVFKPYITLALTDRDNLLLISWRKRLLVGLFSKIDEPIDEADFYLLQLLAAVLEDEAIQHSDRPSHPGV